MLTRGSVRICTFNVQSQAPRTSIQDWMLANSSLTDSNPDMFVFGMQEVDRSAEALLYSTTTIKEELWLAAILRDLGETRASQYDKVHDGTFSDI